MSQTVDRRVTLQGVAQDCSWSGPSFRWEEERRFLLRCELDAAFFHLYLPAEDEKKWGWYRTKPIILDIYDVLAESIRTGEPYQIRRDPAPGSPTDSDGQFILMAEWDPSNWPRHIHQPHKENEVAA